MASKITNVWEVLGHETKWKARLSCGHEVWLTMKERPGLGQEVPCPTCQPTMAAKWYEPGLERTLDALETADCRAAAREVLTREPERLAAAQPTLPSAIDACTACGGTGKEPLPSQPPAPEPGRERSQEAYRIVTEYDLHCEAIDDPDLAWLEDEIASALAKVQADAYNDGMRTGAVYTQQDIFDGEARGMEKERDWWENYVVEHGMHSLLECPRPQNCPRHKRALIPSEQPAPEDKTGQRKA